MVKMKIVVPFIRGPFHAMKFEMEWIPQLHMAIHEKDRIIHCYVREETAYFYDEELSKKMTDNYDIVLKRFGGRVNKIVPVE